MLNLLQHLHHQPIFMAVTAHQFTKPVSFLLLWLLIILGIFLRVDRGDRFPVYQNDDGLFYTWAGLSMLENFSSPTSLSVFETNNPFLIWRSQYMPFEPVQEFGFRIVRPWFDLPPLGTLLISLPAYALGYRGFSQIPHLIVRLPAFVASVFTLLGTYLLGKSLFGRASARWALIFFAVWPLAVFSHRQSYLENILTPFILLALWAFYRLYALRSTFTLSGTEGLYATNVRRWLWRLVLLCVMIAGWIKIPGFGLSLVIAYWLLAKKDWFRLKQLFTVTLISFGLYLIYGHLIGGPAFWQTLTNQAGRGAYLTSWFYMLTTPDVFGPIRDGWWLLGWLALLWVGSRPGKANRFLLINTILWMVVIFVTSGRENTSPWYRYPLFPFLMIALGEVVREFWHSVTQTRAVSQTGFIWAVLFFLFGLTGWELAGFTVGSNVLRFGIVIVIAVFFTSLVSNHRVNRLISQLVAASLIGLMLLGNIAAVRRYPFLRCPPGECLEPTKLSIPFSIE